LRVEFYQPDETTAYDTSEWEFESSAYDIREDIVDELEVISGSGYVDIIASSDITQNWGTGFRSPVSELAFDLQVITDGETVWTPVIGTITVIGDITGGSL
jgi:hypothetical protein